MELVTDKAWYKSSPKLWQLIIREKTEVLLIKNLLLVVEQIAIFF